MQLISVVVVSSKGQLKVTAVQGLGYLKHLMNHRFNAPAFELLQMIKCVVYVMPAVCVFSNRYGCQMSGKSVLEIMLHAGTSPLLKIR